MLSVFITEEEFQEEISVDKRDNIAVYDDFAHHPTAIRETMDGLRRHVGQERIIAVLQFGSNTMRGGDHGRRTCRNRREPRSPPHRR